MFRVVQVAQHAGQQIQRRRWGELVDCKMAGSQSPMRDSTMHARPSPHLIAGPSSWKGRGYSHGGIRSKGPKQSLWDDFQDAGTLRHRKYRSTNLENRFKIRPAGVLQTLSVALLTRDRFNSRFEKAHRRSENSKCHPLMELSGRLFRDTNLASISQLHLHDALVRMHLPRWNRRSKGSKFGQQRGTRTRCRMQSRSQCTCRHSGSCLVHR